MGLISGKWRGGNLLANDGGPGPKKPPNPNSGGRGLGRGGRGGRGGGGGITYLLQATFTSSKTAEVGTLQYGETDGSFTATGGVLDVTAQTTPVRGDLFVRQTDYASGAGYPFLFTLNGSVIQAQEISAGWASSPGVYYHAIIVHASGSIDLHVTDDLGLNLGSVTNSTDEKFAIIQGGFDSSGDYLSSDSEISSHDYGAAFFHHDGSNWKLLHHYDGGDADTYNYPSVSPYDFDGTIDNLLIPNTSYANLLVPTVWDSFTDTNGTAIASHTPEVGGPWTVDSGGFEVQSNQLNGTGSPSIAYVEAGSADVYVEGSFKTSVSSASAFQILPRYADTNNHWMFLIGISTPGDTPITRISERVSGTYTERASSGLGTSSLNTYYRIRGVADGDYMEMSRDRGNNLTYASATTLQSNTKVGIRVPTANDTVDSLLVRRRGTGGEYSSLSNI